MSVAEHVGSWSAVARQKRYSRRAVSGSRESSSYLALLAAPYQLSYVQRAPSTTLAGTAGAQSEDEHAISGNRSGYCQALRLAIELEYLFNLGFDCLMPDSLRIIRADRAGFSFESSPERERYCFPGRTNQTFRVAQF
jgi:hypothetical protein